MQGSSTVMRWLISVLVVIILAVGPATCQVSQSRRQCSGICSCLVVNRISLFGGLGAGLALDKKGNLYVAENVISGFQPQGPFVLKVTPDGKESIFVPRQILGDVTGLAIDKAGNLYVADGVGIGSGQPPANNVIWKADPNGNIVLFVAHVNNPTGLALDSTQNLYVSSYSDNAVYKFSPTGVLIGTVGNGFDSGPYGITFDSTGNLFVAGMGNGYGTRIFKVDPSGQQSVFVDAAPLTGPYGVAFDSAGYLYASYYNGLKILKIAPDGKFKVFPGGGIGDDLPNGIAIDPCGGLYVGLIGQIFGGRTANQPSVVKLSGIATASRECEE